MASQLFQSNYPPACAYCEHSKATADEQMVLCPFKGIVSLQFSCRKYIYNPCKRVPTVRFIANTYTKKDFMI